MPMTNTSADDQSLSAALHGRWLHDCVGGPTTALGYCPLNVLSGVLDVARLAVQAVLRNQVQSLLAVLIGSVLEYSCKASLSSRTASTEAHTARLHTSPPPQS